MAMASAVAINNIPDPNVGAMTSKATPTTNGGSGVPLNYYNHQPIPPLSNGVVVNGSNGASGDDQHMNGSHTWGQKPPSHTSSRRGTPQSTAQTKFPYQDTRGASPLSPPGVLKGIAIPMASMHQTPPICPSSSLSRPTRESVLRRLSEALMRRSLTMIDMSQRGLQPSDARLVKLALLQNASLSVLKLGYNQLGDEGAVTLASGISAHGALESLDLGFNDVGDEGCAALSKAMLSTRGGGSGPSAPALAGGTLHTLYLAGNCIGEEGTHALASVIRGGCGLRRLHLTGNGIGPDGVKALTEAIAEDEIRRGSLDAPENDSDGDAIFTDDMGGTPSRASPLLSQRSGMQELFLGGTGMGQSGCISVSRMLEHSISLRVLSLANCSIRDEEMAVLSASIKQSGSRLPLEALQLSFNEITSVGLESLARALWNSTTLRELRLDNNSIGDQGAHIVSSLLNSATRLEKIDLGFNSIGSGGMKTLMKYVSESTCINWLSVSGNPIDSEASKAVAYALAYNRSLKSMFLDHCFIAHEGQRHITAGIVSNSGISLRNLTGFPLGAAAATLGLPPALENWTNEQLLKFIHLMWERVSHDQDPHERELDPLHFLPSLPGGEATSPKLLFGANGLPIADHIGPLDPATVVTVAKTVFASLGDNGNEVLSSEPGQFREPCFASPLAEDAIMLETCEKDIIMRDDHFSTVETSISANIVEAGESSSSDESTAAQTQPNSSRSTSISPPAPPCTLLADPERKRRIVGWLCVHVHYLNELCQLPFNSSELYRLHQHFFSPLIHDMGGHNCNVVSTVPRSCGEVTNSTNSVGAPQSSFVLCNGNDSILSEPCAAGMSLESVDERYSIPVSDPSMPPLPEMAPRGVPHLGGSVPMLKRKVSYRSLQDAFTTKNTAPVSKLIADGVSGGQVMQPRSKRARRNRSRISYMPRIKVNLRKCFGTLL
mmetsp:Transcript_29524/g.42862  ORF Transcript_29524/g.42862 Transcript_29524/m.42862 type:complete len:948 (+) Transcript_29524:372-3215(+)